MTGANDKITGLGIPETVDNVLLRADAYAFAITQNRDGIGRATDCGLQPRRCDGPCARATPHAMARMLGIEANFPGFVNDCVAQFWRAVFHARNIPHRRPAG
jgi:hypothetical protein